MTTEGNAFQARWRHRFRHLFKSAIGEAGRDAAGAGKELWVEDETSRSPQRFGML
jgi:hypothetical protein